MPKLIMPTSNEDLLALLTAAVQVASDDQATGLNYIEKEWLTQTNTLLPNFRLKVRGLTTAQQRRTQEVAERRVAVDKLSVYIRDFMVGLKRRVEREELSVAYYQFFKLPLDGTLPNPNTLDDIMSWAEILVHGEANAVAAKFEPMCNPTAAQVQVWLTKAQTEAADVPAAERDLNTAQTEVEGLRLQAVELAQDLADQLNFRLRKLDAPGRRRIMRRYHFQYRYAPGEPPEVVDTPPASGEVATGI